MRKGHPILTGALSTIHNSGSTCFLGRSHRASRLKAFTAKYRAALRWPEGYRGFLPALRTGGLCFGAWSGTSAATAAAFRPLRLATLAALRFVLETFVGKEHLFAGGKNKLSAALRTLQDLIVEFHDPAPPGPTSGGRPGSCTAGRMKRLDLWSGTAGRGSLGPAGTEFEQIPNLLCLIGA